MLEGVEESGGGGTGIAGEEEEVGGVENVEDAHGEDEAGEGAAEAGDVGVVRRGRAGAHHDGCGGGGRPVGVGGE